MAGAAEERSDSAAYDELVAEVTERIEALAPAREQARADGLRADAQRELDEARAEYDAQKADAEAQLADAKAQLDDAAAAIAENEQKLADAEAQRDRGAGELASSARAPKRSWRTPSGSSPTAARRRTTPAPPSSRGRPSWPTPGRSGSTGADALARARATGRASRTP